VYEKEYQDSNPKFRLAFFLACCLILLALGSTYFLFQNNKEPESGNHDKLGTLSETTSETLDDDSELNDRIDALIEEAVIQRDAASALNTDRDAPSTLAETDNIDPTQSDANIIEQLSFADAEEADVKINDDTERPLYCLNTQDDEFSPQLIHKSCERISKRLASVSMSLCEAAELLPSGCESVDGFPLLVSEFPPIASREPRGRILVLGGTHGDELTSVSMVFRWIASLKKFHTGLFHWHMVPMMNPDGVLNSSATRTNKNGVDLNRNMPSDDWEVKALKYWKEKVGSKPRRYPGESAASEPETQWLIDEINTFKPDAIISVHAPYGVVDFDSLVLNSAPKTLGELHLNLLGTYPGSLGNYAGINRNIPVITLELPHAWVMPSIEESTKIWEDIVRWLRTNINNTSTP